jgi:hypothetical protein
MKKESLRIVASLALFVLFACAGARAQTAARMKASVPFDFHVGQQTFPAGEYLVERVGRQTIQESLLISSPDGKHSALVRTSPLTGAKGNEGASLVFYRYGDVSFLRQVRGVESDLSLQLPASRDERRTERGTKVAGTAKGAQDESAAARQSVAIPLRRR